MEYTDKEYCLEVWGDFACFTRPEFKVERVSYDVITPSAARAIFEAILFKKYAMRWQITRIEVLNPIQWFSIKRNEVEAVASYTKPKPLNILDGKVHKPRNSLILRDVRYRIWAKLVFIPVANRPKEAFAKHAPTADENPMKYYQMFERRAKAGQCFTQPYFGTREFSASFRLVDTDQPLSPPIPEIRVLGRMLYDWHFGENNIVARLFNVIMENGVITIPDKYSEEIVPNVREVDGSDTIVNKPTE